jgi:hypothetical protein
MSLDETTIDNDRLVPKIARHRDAARLTDTTEAPMIADRPAR